MFTVQGLMTPDVNLKSNICIFVEFVKLHPVNQYCLMYISFISWFSGTIGFCQNAEWFTVLPAKSDSDVMFCLQSYQGLIINISLVC